MQRLSCLIDEAKTAAIDCESLNEKDLKDLARDWAKRIRTDAARRFVDLEKYRPELEPTSIFMAGAPGAGKTELRKQLADFPIEPVLHVDPDDFRDLFPCYRGDNSSLFQGAVSLLMERILDRAFEKKISFCLDGTLASGDVALKNIRRCITKNRLVQIFFVHQDPVKSWKFALAREKVEGRKITCDTFISHYQGCAAVIDKILKDAEFEEARRSKKLTVDIFIRSRIAKNSKWHHRVDAAQFKGLVKSELSEEELHAIIGLKGIANGTP